MISDFDKKLTVYLASFITEKRKSRMEAVLRQRTRYLTVVLEDIYQPHNASAVLRSCDGFGIQNVHVIENRNRFSPNKEVDMGTSQWLTISRNTPKNRDSCTKETLTDLKAKGYRIVATTPHTDDIDLEDFSLDQGKAAIVLGTELEGISSEVYDCADEYLKIPMHGFVESFNISVACALILHHLSWKLRSSAIDWQMTEAEREEVLLDWLRKTVKNADALEARFRTEQPLQ
jgi:tRNA (guanosine-2'-O-)-methyltransferase